MTDHKLITHILHTSVKSHRVHLSTWDAVNRSMSINA